MLTALASSFVVGVFAVAGSSPSVIPTGILAGVGAAAVALAGQLVLRKQTKNKLVAEMADELVGGAKALLEDYRRELTEAKSELVELRERVARLEVELKFAKEQRDEIERERREAFARLERVQARVDELERTLRLLERDSEP